MKAGKRQNSLWRGDKRSRTEGCGIVTRKLSGYKKKSIKRFQITHFKEVNIMPQKDGTGPEGKGCGTGRGKGRRDQGGRGVGQGAG